MQVNQFLIKFCIQYKCLKVVNLNSGVAKGWLEQR